MGIRSLAISGLCGLAAITGAASVSGCSMNGGEGLIIQKGHLVDPNAPSIPTSGGNRYVTAALIGLRVAEEIGKRTHLIITYTKSCNKVAMDQKEVVIPEGLYPYCNRSIWFVPAEGAKLERLGADIHYFEKKYPNEKQIK